MIKTVQRADGEKHQVYGRRNGRKVYVGTFDSKRDAKAADEEHRTRQRLIAQGKLPAESDQQRTFTKAIERWIAMLHQTNSRSAVEYESRARNHMIPAFGDTPVGDIAKPDVVSWRDRVSSKMSPSTVNALLGALSSAFSWFVDQRWIERNPCSRVKQLVRPSKVFPWLQSSEQITRLLVECAPAIRSLVAVLVGTGMRLDEALHLHWDDVDLDHRLLTVHRGRKGMPKSGKMRRVPIFDSVLTVLREMRLARGDRSMLWPDSRRRPGKARTQPWIRKAFHAAVRAAGLPEAMRIHDLRHSFASLFLLDGGDIFKLSRILGHSSVTITERTYAHLRPDAYEGDYGRVSFRMPKPEGGEVVVLASPSHLPKP